MAVTQTQQLPAPFLTDVTKDYAKRLGATTAPALDTSKFAPTVAGQDPYQQEAYGRVPGGIGAYQPYITGAGAAGFAPGAAQMGEAAVSTLGQAGTTLGGIPSYISQAGALAPQTGEQYKSLVQDFMSPYQQQVIDATLDEYDVQSAKGLAGIGQQAALSGQFLGGGREGVQRAEYQSASDRNRALLQAQMLQGGYGQAQAAAGQAFGQQLGLGQATGALGQTQMGLGQAQMGLGQQQLGVGQYQQGLAGLVPQLYGQDTAAYGAAGAQQQAQAQAEADASREAARMEAYEPYERLGYLGTGITGMLGGYPGQYQSQISPNPTPLQSALGIGTGLAGMWGAYEDFMGRPKKS